MEADLRSHLLAATTLTALVADRVTWVDRPSGKGLPAVTLQLISPGREYNHDGPDALQSPRIQIDVWARSHLEASQVARAVTLAIEPAALVGSTRFGRALLEDERDMPIEDLPGQRVFRRQMDFMVWHEPA